MKTNVLRVLLLMPLFSCSDNVEEDLSETIPKTVMEASNNFTVDVEHVSGDINVLTLKKFFEKDSGYRADDFLVLSNYLYHRLNTDLLAVSTGRPEIERDKFFGLLDKLNLGKTDPEVEAFVSVTVNAFTSIHYESNRGLDTEYVTSSVSIQSEGSVEANTRVSAGIWWRQRSAWPFYRITEELVTQSDDFAQATHSCGGNDTKITAIAQWFPTLGKPGAYARAEIGCDD